MNIKWYGHSCFLLTADNGFRILTDPCDDRTGYHLHDIETDLITSSHDHFDHNYFAAAVGNPEIIREPGVYDRGDVHIIGVSTFHDANQGAMRGTNTVFVFEMDDIRIAHLGDLGHMPDGKTLAAIGDVSVLLAPIGGTFTIDHLTTCAIANALHTKVLIPMHYKTAALNMDLLGIQPLLSVVKDCSVHRLNQSDCTVTKDNLGSDRLLVLNYTM